MNLLELLTSGFYAALAQFRTEFMQQQENRDMALSEKLTQILQNQQASDEAMATPTLLGNAAINETISSETSQVAQELTKLVDTNAQQSQTIQEQGQQIKDLLAQVAQGQIDVATVEQTIDQIVQKQQEQLTAQQEAASKIAAIFNS